MTMYKVFFQCGEVVSILSDDENVAAIDAVKQGREKGFLGWDQPVHVEDTGQPVEEV